MIAFGPMGTLDGRAKPDRRYDDGRRTARPSACTTRAPAGDAEVAKLDASRSGGGARAAPPNVSGDRTEAFSNRE